MFLDPRGFRMAIDQMLAPYAGQRFDKVAGLEARGFILGGAIAHQLSVGFVPIRKKGKLPGKTIEQSYIRWNMARPRWSCMTTAFKPVKRCCWSMTCLPLAARRRLGSS